MDMISKFKRMEKMNVMFPISLDSLNMNRKFYSEFKYSKYSETIESNVQNMINILNSLGVKPDLNRTLDMANSQYIKDIQKMFIKLYKEGYIKKTDNSYSLKFKDNEVYLFEGLNENKNYTKYSGASVKFNIKDSDEYIDVFIEEPESIYSISGVELSKTHPYIIKNKSELDINVKDVDADVSIIQGLLLNHPMTGKVIPVYVSSKLKEDYGFVGAKGLKVIPNMKPEHRTIVIKSENGKDEMINSRFLNGHTPEEARKLMINLIKEDKLGDYYYVYELKDFNNTRYISSPVPLVHCSECGVVPVQNRKLPVKIQDKKTYMDSFRINVKNPFEADYDFIKVKCPKCKKDAKREITLMPDWLYSGLISIINSNLEDDTRMVSRRRMSKWGNVDLYIQTDKDDSKVLLNSIILNKLMKNLNVTYDEVLFENIITISNDIKTEMSLNDIIKEYGADVSRLAILMASQDGTNKVEVKTLERFKKMIENLVFISKNITDDDVDEYKKQYNTNLIKYKEQLSDFNIKKTILNLENLTNYLRKMNSININDYKNLIRFMYPFTPHTSEYLWSLYEKTTLESVGYPSIDTNNVIKTRKAIRIKVDGKTRDKLIVDTDIDDKELINMAKTRDKIKELISGRVVVSEYVLSESSINLKLQKILK
jgi:leucyl-tRNA synthetase